MENSGMENSSELDLSNMIKEFQELILQLRQECPWDKQQTHESLKRHLLEETYEVLEAIDALDGIADSNASYESLKDELGDLLYQVFFHSLLASESDHFDIQDVFQNIKEKLYRRHPHIFGDLSIETTEELAPHWEEIKKAEKSTASVMDKLPEVLPALLLAAKIQKKAKTLDLPSHLDQNQIIEDINLRLKELMNAKDNSSVNQATPGQAPVEQEEQKTNQVILGELLWAVTALSLELEVDGEDALRQVAKDFAGKVRKIEITKQEN